MAIPGLGPKNVHSLAEATLNVNGGEEVVVAGTASGVFCMRFNGYLDAPTVTNLSHVEVGSYEHVSGIRVSNGFVAVSSLSPERTGKIVVHKGIREVGHHLALGERVGSCLEGHGNALKVSEIAMLTGGDEGAEMVVAAGDVASAGGVRFWTEERGMDGVRWKDWSPRDDPVSSQGLLDETVRSAQALQLPSGARLDNVPRGVRGLFGCVSDSWVRIFAAGWY